MRIGSHDLEQRVLIVAEIGNNHEGNFARALELVSRAADSGVDAVKFQTFQARLFTSAKDRARFDRLRSFELTQDQFRQLDGLARSLGLIFLSTPLDLESARFLEPLVDAFKIASGDNDFLPLLAQVCQTGKPIIISSGLADEAHMKRTVRFVRDQWQRRGLDEQLAVLHCVCSYPVPPQEANLAAIPVLARALECTIGYSDHTIGGEASLAAVALGARIVEKHFTLDKNLSEFRDHKLSADPPEMRRIVDGVRHVEQLLGRPEKIVQASEVSNAQVARRSIVAARALERGHRLAVEDLTWIRPAVGLPPGEEERVLGRRLRRDLAFGDPILAADLE